jgi:hypothetical protein
MAAPIAEYTVRNYSALDAQIEQIAERERVLTNRLKISNYKQIALYAGAALLALGVFLVLAGFAYSLAFPKMPKVIEKVQVVEKIIEPQKIIIQTPQGSYVTRPGSSNTETSSPIWGKPAKEIASSNEVSSSSVDNNSKEIASSNNASSSSVDNNPKEISKNSKPNSVDNSSLPDPKVTTFTNVPSGIIGFRDVVTGWNWEDQKDKSPNEQYCYVQKDGVLDETVPLGGKGAQDQSPTNKYNSETSKKAGLSQTSWRSLFTKCQWFSM